MATLHHISMAFPSIMEIEMSHIINNLLALLHPAQPPQPRCAFFSMASFAEYCFYIFDAKGSAAFSWCVGSGYPVRKIPQFPIHFSDRIAQELESTACKSKNI